MITEDYVSFETAKLLKEKGFYGECMSMYVTPKPHAGMGNPNEAKIAPHGRDSHYYDGYLYQCEAPTLQMAMKWLREIYKLEVRNTYDYDKDSWWGNINPMFEETDENSEVYQKALGFDYQGKSYEEACEAVIKYCLENLI